MGPGLAIAEIRALVLGRGTGIALVPRAGVVRGSDAGNGDIGAGDHRAGPGRLARRARATRPADRLRLGVAGRGAGMAVAAARAFPLELSGPGPAACGTSAKATSGMLARPAGGLDAVGSRGAAYRRLRRTRSRLG